MKSNARKIIKAVLLSATAALLHGSAKADGRKMLDLAPGLGNGITPSEASRGKQTIMKNVYAILRSGETKLIAGHRSHRSHSSHRSSRGGHYSHSSSSHYSHSSSSYGSSRSSAATTHTPVTPAKTTDTYTLGDRFIVKGSYGADVDELVALLTKAGYAPNPDKLERKAGHYVFTDDIAMAIKAFQAFNGIKPGGEPDTTTMQKLKSFRK